MGPSLQFFFVRGSVVSYVTFGFVIVCFFISFFLCLGMLHDCGISWVSALTFFSLRSITGNVVHRSILSNIASCTLETFQMIKHSGHMTFIQRRNLRNHYPMCRVTFNRHAHCICFVFL